MCTSQHGITLRNSSLYLRYFYSRGPTNVKIVHCTVRCLLLETKFHQLVPSSSPFMIQQTVLYTKKTVKKKKHYLLHILQILQLWTKQGNKQIYVFSICHHIQKEAFKAILSAAVTHKQWLSESSVLPICLFMKYNQSVSELKGIRVRELLQQYNSQQDRKF